MKTLHEFSRGYDLTPTERLAIAAIITGFNGTQFKINPRPDFGHSRILIRTLRLEGVPPWRPLTEQMLIYWASDYHPRNSRSVESYIVE